MIKINYFDEKDYLLKEIDTKKNKNNLSLDHNALY